MKLLTGVFLSGIILFNVNNIYAQPQTETAVIAYFAGSPATLDKYDLNQLTHIIFSFGHLKGNKLHISNARDTLTIQKMVAWKAKNPKLKVLLSLGGWGGCAPCSEVFSTKEGRSDFAKSVKELLDYFRADGIDLDWEYPAISGYPGHRFVPEDKDNFTYLVQELRKVLGNKALITFAAGGFQKFLDESADWKPVMDVVDFVNIMSYDLVNGYSKVTGHHTPLFSSNPEMESTDRAVTYLEKIGIPSNKLVIGAAFYARVWKNVPDINHGLYQSGDFLRTYRFAEVDSMVTNKTGFTKFWDDATKAPYAYNPSEQIFMTFDDMQSVRLKTEYAIRKGLRGIMFWQLADDSPAGGLLSEIYRTKNMNTLKKN
ncbi:MAG: glycoside hydrolase family 18 protein [Chitinophagaceae bacterium]|nr:glycoside hydrolase family 18 protein [Chitinophagaceae bacterium]